MWSTVVGLKYKCKRCTSALDVFAVTYRSRFIENLTHCPGKIRGQMERMLVAAATPVLTNIGLARLPDGCEVCHLSPTKIGFQYHNNYLM